MRVLSLEVRSNRNALSYKLFLWLQHILCFGGIPLVPSAIAGLPMSEIIAGLQLKGGQYVVEKEINCEWVVMGGLLCWGCCCGWTGG